MPAANKVLPQWGLTCFYEAFVHHLRLQLDELPEVTADREKIRQVLVNLISNAVKYSPTGGEVLLTARKENGMVEIRVTDQGIGMSKEAQGRIFERFYRDSDPRIETYPGLGLGLYIAAEIARRHHGSITVDSQPGAGSTFCFTFPVCPETVDGHKVQ